MRFSLYWVKYTIVSISFFLLISCNSSSPRNSTSATNLSFIVQPSNTTPSGTTNGTISPAIQVQILDQFGHLVESATNKITLTIGNNPGAMLTLESVVAIPSSATPYTGLGLFTGLLSGTIKVKAINGVATFSGLGISQIGNNYTLIASSPGITSAVSNTFNVIASTAGYSTTTANEGSEIANLTGIGSNYQGYVQVYIAQAPNQISESAFITWSQPGWTVNTPRYAIFDYSNTLGSPNASIGPLTQYVDNYGYTWGYIAQTQNYDWPFNPSNYPSPEPTSGWEAGQTQAVVPAGVIKYNSINKNQLYIFTALNPTTHQPTLRYFITDSWGNVFTMKSSNKDNNTESTITAAFEAAELPAGWTKTMGYLPQDLYGYPIYGESTNSMFNDFRDSADNAYTQIVWGINGNSVAQQIGNPMPIYAGPAGARLNGNILGNSLMYGSNGDDQFYPESGGNIINGNAGFNGVFYPGKFREYTIIKSSGVVTVSGPNNTDDTLTNIQYLQFSDESVAVAN